MIFTNWQINNLRFRSSHLKVFCKKGVLGNFTNFIGTHLCQRLSFNKVSGLRPATLLKKSLWHRCFPVNFVKFLRTPFFYRTPPVAASGCSMMYIMDLLMSAIKVLVKIETNFFCSWIFSNFIYVILCAISYNLYHLKTWKTTMEDCYFNFTKSSAPQMNVILLTYQKQRFLFQRYTIWTYL